MRAIVIARRDRADLAPMLVGTLTAASSATLANNECAERNDESRHALSLTGGQHRRFIKKEKQCAKL